MKKSSNFFKKLYEEKLIMTKEDGEAGGGVDVGGGVVNSPSSNGDSGGIVQNDITQNPGLSTTDILGKCDHKKDGVFGPGCFHLPCIWSIPAYRLPRKKRKKLKYSNILKEDDGFNAFQELFKKSLSDNMKIAQKMLSKIDPEIKLNLSKNYEFKDKKADWVAATDFDNQKTVKDFRLAFNIGALYEFLYNKGLDDDNLEIDLQVRMSLYHEIAHALIQYFQDEEIFDFELSELEEEKIAEEFAKYQIKEYTGVTSSKLNNFLKKEYIQESLDEAQKVRNSDIRLKTNFTKPINLADKRRVIPRKKARELKPIKKKFVVNDIEVPDSPEMFIYQEGNPATVSIRDNGVAAIRIKAIPHNDIEEIYLQKKTLPERDAFLNSCLEIFKFRTDPSNKNTKYETRDDIDAEVDMYTENMSIDEFDDVIFGLQQIGDDDLRTWWFNITLTDIIRLARLKNNVKTIPFSLLDTVEEIDFQKDSDYIREFEKKDSSDIVLEDYHDFWGDILKLQYDKGHFKHERWKFLNQDMNLIKIQNLRYFYEVPAQETTQSYYEYKTYRHYVFSNGLILSYAPYENNLITAYYATPRDLVHDIRICNKQSVRYGNISEISVELLSNCFDNILNGRAVSDHPEKFKDLRPKDEKKNEYLNH